MGWSIGFDEKWNRDIGYGVPAYCDHPGCMAKIDRGLSHVCGQEPFGGERGCGLFFCEKHLHWHERLPQLCSQCAPRIKKPFVPTPDHPVWVSHKLTDKSWAPWRKENPKEVEAMKKQLAGFA